MDWRALTAGMDAVIDDTWGEPIRFTPWKAGTYAAGARDQSRAIVNTVGVLFFDKEVVPGASTMERNGSRFESRMVEADIRLSVPAAAIINMRQGDLVEPTDPVRAGAKFEFVTAIPDGTGRSMIHLIRRP